MKTYASVSAAQADKAVVYIWAGPPVVGYVAGDTVSPAHIPPATSSIPQEVTMRQARLALNAIGKLAAVTTALNAMADPAKTQGLIEWEYSSTVQRNKPLVLALGPALSLTATDLDNLFITAATL